MGNESYKSYYKGQQSKIFMYRLPGRKRTNYATWKIGRMSWKRSFERKDDIRMPKTVMVKKVMVCLRN